MSVFGSLGSGRLAIVALVGVVCLLVLAAALGTGDASSGSSPGAWTWLWSRS